MPEVGCRNKSRGYNLEKGNTEIVVKKVHTAKEGKGDMCVTGKPEM